MTRSDNATPSVPHRPINLLAVVQHPVGGIRTYIKYVYGRLPAHKYRFTILRTETTELDLNASDLADRQVTFLTCSGRRGLPALLLLLFRTLASGRYDVIHSHGYTAAVAAATANLLFRVPHVVTPQHILQPDDFPPPWSAIKRWLLARSIRLADVIHCVGREAEANLLETVPEAKTIVIRNGIDVTRFEPPPDHRSAWRDGLELAGGTLLFGFLGRMMPQKGFAYLTDAVQILASKASAIRPFKVAVLSDGGFVREQRARVHAAGLSDYFIFRPPVSDVAPVLFSLDAVVMPSIWEACSLLTMEVLSSGCPLVASHCIGIRELTEDSPALMVPPANAPALARAMLLVLTQPDAATRAARAFAPVARRRFDVRSAAEGLDKLVNTVLAPRQYR